jgi:hypothetical protein
MNDRHFTAPVDEISGTVDSASAGGITLKEYPDQTPATSATPQVQAFCASVYAGLAGRAGLL